MDEEIISSKKRMMHQGVFLMILIGVFGIALFELLRTQYTPVQESDMLSESEARMIAETVCIKDGDSLDSGVYNENTKTWWFDANLNSSKQGCNPACVVREDTKTAEINWRCTGLRSPDETMSDDVFDEIPFDNPNVSVTLPPSNSPVDAPLPEPVACTMDAKICPDGTAVGRIGPNCEFAPCLNGI